MSNASTIERVESKTKWTREAEQEAWAAMCATSNSKPRDSDRYLDGYPDELQAWRERYAAACAEFDRIKGLRFNTRERRICYVAHVFNHQYSHVAEFRRMGFTADEIREGIELGEARIREYSLNCRIHGDPAYGRWGVHGPAPEQPVADRIQAMFDVLRDEAVADTKRGM